MNIEQATVICLKKIPKICEKFRKYFFRKTALADPLFTLDGGFQLFWAASDMLVTVIPLKLALGLEKNDFWAFQKIIQKTLGTYKSPKKSIFPNPMTSFNDTTVKLRSKAEKTHRNLPTKVNIEQAVYGGF